MKGGKEKEAGTTKPKKRNGRAAETERAEGRSDWGKLGAMGRSAAQRRREGKYQKI
jgi:hypothetical protein